jgi:hypothetical protein
VDSPLGQVEVPSLEISVSLDPLKSLQEFRDAFFLGLDVESPLEQLEVASLEISVLV